MPPRTPLVRPDRYFADRELSPARVFAVVGVVLVGVLAVFYGMGWILTDRIDGTVEIDNPERPADWACEGDFPIGTLSGCEQPRTVERNVDTVLWEAWGSAAGKLFMGVMIGWLLLGSLLHVGSWFAGGKHGFFPSFAVAAWGMLPMLVSGIALLVALYVTFEPITVTAANQDTALESAIAQFGTLEAVKAISFVATTAWSAIIWRYGLEHQRGISPGGAWGVSGGVAVLTMVATIV